MRISLRELTDEDRPYVRPLFSNASELYAYVQEFESAVVLFHEAPTLHREHGTRWPFLAAKHAIVTVYNYSMALKGVRTQARHIGFLEPVIGQIDQNREELRLKFPDLKELRQTVLHQAEKHWSEENSKRHSTRGGSTNEFGVSAGPLAMSACLADETYIATFSGREVRFSMHPEKVNELRRLRDNLEAVFVQRIEDYERNRQ